MKSYKAVSSPAPEITHVFQPHQVYTNGCVICGCVAEVHPVSGNYALDLGGK